MGNLFNVDNPFFTVMGKLVDLFVISIIWIFLCMPIITAGPATTALYYVCVKVIRRERGYLLREYFKCFKLNFKQGAILSIIFLVLSIVLYVDRNIVFNFEQKSAVIFYAVFNGITLIGFAITIYIFPILSRFTMSIKQLLKAAVFMSVRHLPFTVIMGAIIIATLFAVSKVVILIFIAPALCCLICSMFLERIFKKYMPQKSESDENSAVDEWYLE